LPTASIEKAAVMRFDGPGKNDTLVKAIAIADHRVQIPAASAHVEEIALPHTARISAAMPAGESDLQRRNRREAE
jgi:hypothetical protein